MKAEHILQGWNQGRSSLQAFSLSSLAKKPIGNAHQTVFDENWRYHASLCNVPANSQTLGQIAYESVIEAILYPSTKDGKKCLALFPKKAAFIF